jgi:hypothetical protein
MDIVWPGIMRPASLGDMNAVRQELARAAREYEWPKVLQLVKADPELVNSARPGGSSWYAPLHQVAYAGADSRVARRLIKLGAWRTLKTAKGERPLDIALRRGNVHLIDVLTPALRWTLADEQLERLQSGFHAVIRGRANEYVLQHRIRLPELSPLLELVQPKMWFRVLGMYGGFSYWLDFVYEDPVLITESWCRVAGGSAQRHVVSKWGSLLVSEGFDEGPAR